MFDAIINALKSFFLWVLDAFVAMGRGIINLLLGMLPHDATGALGGASASIAWFVNAVNGWIPLDVACSLGVLWLGWVVACALFRTVRQLIP